MGKEHQGMLPPASYSQDAAAIVSRALSMRHHARQDPYCTAGVPEIHAQGLKSGPAMDSKTVHIISGAIPACFSGTGKRMKSRAVDWLHSLRHAGSAGIPPSRGNSKWKHFLHALCNGARWEATIARRQQADQNGHIEKSYSTSTHCAHRSNVLNSNFPICHFIRSMERVWTARTPKIRTQLKSVENAAPIEPQSRIRRRFPATFTAAPSIAVKRVETLARSIM